jgi:hypothetical protein
VLGQKYFPIPYNFLKNLAYIVGTIGIIYVVNLVELDSQWLVTAFHAVVILVYLSVIYLLERSYLRQPIT